MITIDTRDWQMKSRITVTSASSAPSEPDSPSDTVSDTHQINDLKKADGISNARATATPPTLPRRRFLRGAIAVVPIAAVGTAMAPAQDSKASESNGNGQSAATSATPEKPYQPAFFHADEWAFLQAAVDRLIPHDALGAGALDAGVPEFLDRQMQLPYGHGQLWYMQGPFVTDAAPELGYQLKLAPRDIYRTGIAAVDQHCTSTLGHPFAALDGAVQDKVLHGLETGSIKLDALPAKTFFSLLLDNTREGFLSDPMYGGNKNMVGWKFAGFPGARADFLDWVDHPNEPYPLGPVSILGERG